VGNTVLIDEYRLSEPGEHETQIADDGKLPAPAKRRNRAIVRVCPTEKIKDSKQIKTKSKHA
jgi:hypothetical protein